MQLIGPTYNLESRPASVQRTVNMVPVPLEPGNERAGWVFKDVPGLVHAVLEWSSAVSDAVFVAQSTANSGVFVNSFGLVIPASAQPGDFAVALVASSTTHFPSTPAGWTLYSNLEVLSAGRLRIFTRTLQAGDANPAFNITNTGTSVEAVMYVYRGASGIVGDVRNVNAAAASTVSFPQVTSVKRNAPVILGHLRSGLSVASFLSFTNEGNIGPISIGRQNSVSPNACGWAIARGLLTGDNLSGGTVTATQNISGQYTNVALLIG